MTVSIPGWIGSGERIMSLHSYLELKPSVAARAVTVRVTRQFSTTIEWVFDTWLDPVTAGSFLFATDAGEVVSAEIDARIGGRFTFVRRENGREVRRSGVYVSIERPHLLVFSLSDNANTPADDRVIIELASVGPGSLMVLTHEMSLGRYAERHRIESEWMRRLGRLAFLRPTLRGADLSFPRQRQ
jgi:uncharacterized protein YndB with AHSA1/START domain